MNNKPAFTIAFFAILLASGPLFLAGWVTGITMLGVHAVVGPAPLQEASDALLSKNSTWWVNSGGLFYPSATGGRTNRGELPETSYWRLAYFAANPTDTDNGYHPQNIFRLVSRAKRAEIAQQAYFTISKYHVSDSPNRNESNGILFFNRYVDSNNLYYVGLRVDGYAVIKKKKNGVYYTLAYKRVLPSEAGIYHRSSNPNLLWMNTPIGLRSEVRTFSRGRVGIRLFMDKGKTGVWTRMADVIDDGISYGGAAILDAGSGGVRTDFMDVSFEDYKMSAP